MFIRKPLFYMAEGGDGGAGAGEGGTGDGGGSGGGASGNAGAESQGGKPDDGKTYTQADIERIISGRLSKYADYDEVKQKLTEFEQQGLSEVEKLTGRLTTAEENAQTATTELTRLQVALNHGLVTQKDGKFVLDEDAMKLLGTGTAEELEERAKLIAARSAQQQTPSRGFNHGAAGGAPKGDMNSLIFGALRK